MKKKALAFSGCVQLTTLKIPKRSLKDWSWLQIGLFLLYEGKKEFTSKGFVLTFFFKEETSVISKKVYCFSEFYCKRVILSYRALFHWVNIVKPNRSTESQRPIRRKETTLDSRWELKIKTTKLPKAWENVGDEGVIGFIYTVIWLVVKVVRIFWTNHRTK